MCNPIVKFIPESAIRTQVHTAFLQHHEQLSRLLPDADIQHVGSTAIPGFLTKGDLDIQVRIPASQFQMAEQILTQHFEHNEGSTRTEAFSSFKNDSLAIPLGIQLSVIDSKFDFFWKLRDLFLENPALVEDYNQIKRQFEGKSMEDYLVAKTEFIESIISKRINT